VACEQQALCQVSVIFFLFLGSWRAEHRSRGNPPTRILVYVYLCAACCTACPLLGICRIKRSQFSDQTFRIAGFACGWLFVQVRKSPASACLVDLNWMGKIDYCGLKPDAAVRTLMKTLLDVSNDSSRAAVLDCTVSLDQFCILALCVASNSVSICALLIPCEHVCLCLPLIESN